MTPNKGKNGALVLRLYVAGNSPRSLQAKANLEAISSQYPLTPCEIEVVDVLEEPLRMIADEIMVTPTLVKVSPLPAVKLIGDLSDRARVALVLSPKTSA